MEVALPQSATQEIEISTRHKYNSLSIFFAILTFLLIATSISFGAGFLVGKYQAVNAESTALTKRQSSSVGTNSKGLYLDKNEGYKVSYTKIWKATKRELGVPGVVLESVTARVEIWISVEQPVILNAEQKASVEKTNLVAMTLEGQRLKMTEYVYKAGNYFSTLVLPAKNNNPKVTFWIKASEKDSYDQALKIVQSFTFLLEL